MTGKRNVAVLDVAEILEAEETVTRSSQGRRKFWAGRASYCDDQSFTLPLVMSGRVRRFC